MTTRGRDLGTVDAGEIREIEKREAAVSADRNGIGNILRAIEKNLPDALQKAKDRRAELVADLAAMNQEIARLETHHAISISEAESEST